MINAVYGISTGAKTATLEKGLFYISHGIWIKQYVVNNDSGTL